MPPTVLRIVCKVGTLEEPEKMQSVTTYHDTALCFNDLASEIGRALDTGWEKIGERNVAMHVEYLLL